MIGNGRCTRPTPPLPAAVSAADVAGPTPARSPSRTDGVSRIVLAGFGAAGAKSPKRSLPPWRMAGLRPEVPAVG